MRCTTCKPPFVTVLFNRHLILLKFLSLWAFLAVGQSRALEGAWSTAPPRWQRPRVLSGPRSILGPAGRSVPGQQMSAAPSEGAQSRLEPAEGAKRRWVWATGRRGVWRTGYPPECCGDICVAPQIHSSSRQGLLFPERRRALESLRRGLAFPAPVLTCAAHPPLPPSLGPQGFPSCSCASRLLTPALLTGSSLPGSQLKSFPGKTAPCALLRSSVTGRRGQRV